MPRPLISQKEFKDQIRAKLGDGVLDLSEAVYKGRRRTVTVVCLQNPEHGASTLLAGNLLKGRGCPKCGLEQRIERSKTALAAIRAARPQRDPKPKPPPRTKPSRVASKTNRAHDFENADEPKKPRKLRKPDKLNESDISKRPQLDNTRSMERGCDAAEPQEAVVAKTAQSSRRARRAPAHRPDWITWPDADTLQGRLDQKHGAGVMRVLCLRGHSGSSRVDLECLVDPTHGQWSPVISSVLRDTGCPKCGRIRSEAFKKTKSDETKQRLQARIDRAHGAGKIAFSEESYINSKLPVEVRCLVDSEHGTWPVVISVLLRGRGCPKCWEQAQAAKTAGKGGGKRKPPARRASAPRVPGLGTLAATAPLPGYPPGFPYYSGKPTTLLGKSFPSLSQAAQHFGIKVDVLRKRRAAGWTDEQILGLAPSPGIRRRIGAVEIKGETFLSLLEAVQFYRASYEKVLLKLKHGLSIEEAVLQSQAEVELARKRAEAAELRRRFGASKSALVDYVRTDPKVYVIRNTVNSKEYVGVTDQTLATRFGSHKRDARTGKGPPEGLHRAMRELGIDKFSIELLERFPTYQDAAQAEVRLIAERGTRVPNGYNLREGGNFGQISGKVYEVDGVKYYGLRTLARSFGLPDCRVAYRLNAGWTLRQSLGLDPPPVKETKVAVGTPQAPRSYVVTDLANRDYFVQDMPAFARDIGVSPRTNPIRNLASRGYTTRRAKGWKCRYATSEDEVRLPRWAGLSAD